MRVPCPLSLLVLHNRTSIGTTIEWFMVDATVAAAASSSFVVSACEVADSSQEDVGAVHWGFGTQSLPSRTVTSSAAAARTSAGSQTCPPPDLDLDLLIHARLASGDPPAATPTPV
eukprot:TRINITY_DN62286_c0_g1_i2.p1 TRINITY_DN62286_c0_g1~~TRINITY_DN62286_c0_g1_i2.p1  ORF type:complete len:116 (+),score=4.19 TRINITY_DN62286_c0_g1_i2:180-527(+)